MSFHDEILTERQRKALRFLGPGTAERDFFLAGGTAIALYLGHRRSVDFDWFHPNQIPDPLRLSGEIQGEGIPFETGQVARGTLYGSVHGVRVSFLEFRYPMLVPWPEYGCRLAGLRDLACMKLSAIAQRGSRKDFIDVYALGQTGHTLPDMLAWYREKFKVEDVGHVLYALTYFDDAEAERMPRMLWQTPWKQIKQAIQDQVRDLSPTV
jgi:Nucleotidyl transferase AbiEii toxin, Type IV TA system